MYREFTNCYRGHSYYSMDDGGCPYCQVERNKKWIVFCAIISIVFLFAGIPFLFTNHPMWGWISIVGVFFGGMSILLVTKNKKLRTNIAFQKSIKRETIEGIKDFQSQNSHCLKDSITIGRITQNDIIISNPLVSRVHCRIERIEEGRYRVTDLNSANGTYVNGKRIEGSMEIGPFDNVSVYGGSNVQWVHLFGGPGRGEPLGGCVAPS